MIYSATDDNWMRVTTMHAIVKTHYDSTRGSEFRNRQISNGPFFPFDVTAFDTMQRESCLIGMLMAWSVVFLESLANHILAENLNNRLVAITSIEKPKSILPKFNSRSELAVKIILINDQKEVDRKILETADSLADQRNRIVHDKPFWLDRDSGEIVNYSNRGVSGSKTPSYEDLEGFFADCDLIVQALISESENQEIRFSFASMI